MLETPFRAFGPCFNIYPDIDAICIRSVLSTLFGRLSGSMVRMFFMDVG